MHMWYFLLIYDPLVSNQQRFVLFTIVYIQDAVEYAECEAAVKDFPPFREAMKRRGIEDMDLVMVDAWLVANMR